MGVVADVTSPTRAHGGAGDGVTTDEVLAMIIMGKQPGEVTDTDIADLHQ